MARDSVECLALRILGDAGETGALTLVGDMLRDFLVWFALPRSPRYLAAVLSRLGRIEPRQGLR